MASKYYFAVGILFNFLNLITHVFVIRHESVVHIALCVSLNVKNPYLLIYSPPKFYLFDCRYKCSQVHGAPVTDIVEFSVQAQEVTKPFSLRPIPSRSENQRLIG